MDSKDVSVPAPLHLEAREVLFLPGRPLKPDSASIPGALETKQLQGKGAGQYDIVLYHLEDQLMTGIIGMDASTWAGIGIKWIEVQGGGVHQGSIEIQRKSTKFRYNRIPPDLEVSSSPSR